MSTGEAIPIPAPTRERLERMITERDRIGALIDATLLAVREALEVPQDYVIRDLESGFVAPEKPQE